MVDYLDVDPVLPNDQMFALMSCAIPKDAGSNKFALKIRGCFKTTADARTFLEKLNKQIPKHQQTPTFVVDVGKWLCMPPPTNEEIVGSGGEEVFQEEFLQKMMKGYQENVQQKDEFFTQRKNIIKETSLTNDPEPFSLHETLGMPPPEPFIPFKPPQDTDSSILS
jgi:hypothetical protein